MVYVEALLWYLLLVDSIIYIFLSWSQGKWHKKASHWLSGYIELSKGWSIVYFALVLWLGFALVRLSVVSFS